MVIRGIIRKLEISLVALACVIGLAATSASAETIRLKNGRVIYADTVRETPTKVEYTIGDSSFAIPRSAVDKIDSGGSPIVSRRDESPTPAPEVPNHFGGAEGIEAAVIHDGEIDTAALADFERSGGNEVAAVANYVAAKRLADAGKFDDAVRYFDRALAYLPNNPVLMGHQAALFIQMARFKEAGDLAERITRIAPDKAFGWGMLGIAAYQLGRPDDAVSAIQHSLALEPNDKNMKDLLVRAQRELAAEAAFTEEASSHFTMKFEGGAAPAALRRQVLETLEVAYNDLVRDLDYAPRESVLVVLYTDKQYFDVTQAPSWAGALYDGKLRLPISGITQVGPDLARTLKHELTHSFIHLITKGRCPTWLNEGIAQVLEPRSAASSGRRLAALYAANRNIPFNQLEGQWGAMPAEVAHVAYDQSLAAADYIQSQYGVSALAGVLKRIGSGQSTELSLRSEVHSGYAGLEHDLADYLRRTYGG